MIPQAALVLARHDSFVKAGLRHADNFRSLGTRVDVVTVSSRRSGLSALQATALGLGPVPQRLSLRQVCKRSFLESYDTVFLGLDGRHTREFMWRFCDTFSADTGKRPVIVSYYPGVVFRFHFEGMQSRMSADLMLLNSRHDERLYRTMLDGMGVDTNNGLRVGLSYVPAPTAQPRLGTDILFFGQPTVPPGLHERAYIVERLVGIAARYRESRVVLKPRHRPTEKTLHRDRYHFAALVEAYRSRRPISDNLIISYEPVSSLLKGASVALTVSSSAALEALGQGIPARILTDFGIHENLGNHLFLGSGLLCTFDEVSPSMPYVVESAWTSDHFESGAANGRQVVEAVGRLLDERESGGALPLPTARMLGRTAAFREFATREFGPGAYGEFTARSRKFPLAATARWRFGGVLRRLVRGPKA